MSQSASRPRWCGAASALAACTAAAALAACGGSNGPRRGQSGAELFVRSCSACHSLVGNESLRRQGGDLLGFRFTRVELTQYTREMPARYPLTASEIAAIVAYVMAREQRRG